MRWHSRAPYPRRCCPVRRSRETTARRPRTASRRLPEHRGEYSSRLPSRRSSRPLRCRPTVPDPENIVDRWRFHVERTQTDVDLSAMVRRMAGDLKAGVAQPRGRRRETDCFCNLLRPRHLDRLAETLIGQCVEMRPCFGIVRLAPRTDISQSRKLLGLTDGIGERSARPDVEKRTLHQMDVHERVAQAIVRRIGGGDGGPNASVRPFHVREELANEVGGDHGTSPTRYPTSALRGAPAPL